MKKSRFSHTTMPQALGQLELSVMKSLWANHSATAKEMVESLASSHPCTLSTIQSTLERLVRKGLLNRVKQGHSFLYSPRLTRAELLGGFLKDVITLFHDGNPRTILSSFVTAASKIDDSSLDELQQLIEKKRAEMKGGHD